MQQLDTGMNRDARRGGRFLPTIATVGLLFAAGTFPAAADRLIGVRGAVIEDTVVALADGHIALSNATMSLDDVWQIEHAPAKPPAAPARERVILQQGELPARNVTMDRETCRFEWDGAPGAAVPRTAIRALVFEAGALPDARAALTRALDKRSAADQVLALGPDNAPLSIAGMLAAVGTNAVAVNYQGQERAIARSRVCATVLGATGTAARAASFPSWKITTTGGAWIETPSVRLAGDLLTVNIGTGVLDIPWNRVSRLEYRGRRLRFLSDLEPAATTQDALVTLPLPWQRNRNAMGEPLRLQGVTCDWGLGMHAPAELLFHLPQEARRLLATVGLDEQYGSKGDCVVVVRAGDCVLFNRRLRGGEAPQAVDVELPPGGRLTLRAEPGENHDLGDHVNWYDARLLLDP
jgi:hypothetical protein